MTALEALAATEERDMGRTLTLAALVLAGTMAMALPGCATSPPDEWKATHGGVDPMTDREMRWAESPGVYAEDGTAYASILIGCPDSAGDMFASHRVFFGFVGMSLTAKKDEHLSQPNAVLRMRFDRGDVKEPLAHMQFLEPSHGPEYVVGVILPGAAEMNELFFSARGKREWARIPILVDFLIAREVLVELMNDAGDAAYFRIPLTGSRAAYREACGAGR